MQLASVAQQAVGAQPVSDLTEEKLQAQFEDMMTIMVLPAEIALPLPLPLPLSQPDSLLCLISASV